MEMQSSALFVERLISPVIVSFQQHADFYTVNYCCCLPPLRSTHVVSLIKNLPAAPLHSLSPTPPLHQCTNWRNRCESTGLTDTASTGFVMRAGVRKMVHIKCCIILFVCDPPPHTHTPPSGLGLTFSSSFWQV